jgi:hypothetical protein
MPQDTHIPEFAVAAMPAHMASLPSPLRGGSTAVAQRRRSGWGSSQSHDPPPQPSPSTRAFTPVFDGLWGEGARELATVQDSNAPTRPIRLFARPEPVEAVAEVPDGPPVRFRWRHVLHEVAQAEGPERIAMEWWRDADNRALTRDYFRVESREGVRVWLFREGLLGSGQTRWFLHGVFA